MTTVDMADQQSSQAQSTVDSGRRGRRISCLLTPTVKEAIAELCGTFVLMIFGMGSVAQLVLSEGKIGSPDQVRWSWGFGVTFGVYVSGGISGGHLNPAVTFALCLFKKTPWCKLIPYWIGQYLGAFIAACFVYLIYYDALSDFKGGDQTLETAGIFSTYPQSYLSAWNGLADQAFGTAILMLLIMALTDPSNMAPSKGYLPLAVGCVVTVIGMTYSQNCGYAINPARDLSPRLFTLMAGWGTQVVSVNDYKWFWIPVVGPHLGAIVGAWVYVQFLQMTCPCSAACFSSNPSTTWELQQTGGDKETATAAWNTRRTDDNLSRGADDVECNATVTESTKTLIRSTVDP